MASSRFSSRITALDTKPCSDIMEKIGHRDPHTMPLGELYRLTGGWDGVREALGIQMCTLSYKDKCAKIMAEHKAKQEKFAAEYKLEVEKSRQHNAAISARIAAEHEALLARKRLQKRKAEEDWGKLTFYLLFFKL